VTAPTRPDGIDLLIRSYYRDRRWLGILLRSIERYVTGFRRAVVVVPTTSVDRLDPAAFSGRPWTRLVTCPTFENDYLGQQVTKLYADCYSDAPVVLHLDSDQVFHSPCDLAECLFDAGRLRISYNRSPTRPAGDGWRRCAEDFFGSPIPCDLTSRMPLALRRDVYGGLRAHCRSRHGVELSTYVLSSPADRFSELALLRAFVLLNHASDYAWIDSGSQELIPQLGTYSSRADSPEDVPR
jgi:hypothetical protein